MRAFLFAVSLVFASPAGADTPPANNSPAAGAPADKALSAGELDALVAQVALYPDTLLGNVFIASTYPLEVVQAARWLESNKQLKGKALEDALAKQTWDDSVKSLARVPQVLTMMNERIDWTQKLGDAVLAQQADVMSAVQRLRAQAQKQGALKTTEQQKVEVTNNTIVIEPAQPDTVYVPYYNPTTVYGSWPYPAYPPYYYPPPAYVTPYGGALAFGLGVAITAGIWNNCGMGWGSGDININNNFNSNRNFNGGNRNQINGGNRNNIGSGNRGNGGRWSHNPSHRKGVNYGNNAVRNKYGKGTMAGADGRRDFRGFDNTSRGLGNRGNSGIGDRGNSGLGNRGNAGVADRGNFGGNRGASDLGGNRGSFNGGLDRSGFGQNGRGGGFDGLGNGGSTRSFSQRGNSSLGGRGSSSGSRGGSRGGFSGGGRGGGGGGGRGGGRR